jgi:hypothetical protein
MQDGKANENTSILGFQVRVKIVIDISVRWSVDLWAKVLFGCFNAVVSSTLNFKETLMNTLTEIVLFGAALLPVPGWLALHQYRDVMAR